MAEEMRRQTRIEVLTGRTSKQSDFMLIGMKAAARTYSGHREEKWTVAV